MSANGTRNRSAKGKRLIAGLVSYMCICSAEGTDLLLGGPLFYADYERVFSEPDSQYITVYYTDAVALFAACLQYLALESSTATNCPQIIDW